MTDKTQDGIVVIGASAGGFSAVVDLLSELSPGFPLPVIVAVHSPPGSVLSQALNLKRALSIPIKQVENDEELTGGTVYILPGATHGMVKGRSIRLSDLVHDSGFRPSIDALFMTAAAEYGDNAVAVVLSGTMRDGMRGAQVIYDMGGMTIVQDPADADYAEMPQSVINADHPREVLSASKLGEWLAETFPA